jgi:hypothetical protein
MATSASAKLAIALWRFMANSVGLRYDQNVIARARKPSAAKMPGR